MRPGCPARKERSATRGCQDSGVLAVRQEWQDHEVLLASAVQLASPADLVSPCVVHSILTHLLIIKNMCIISEVLTTLLNVASYRAVIIRRSLLSRFLSANWQDLKRIGSSILYHFSSSNVSYFKKRDNRFSCIMLTDNIVLIDFLKLELLFVADSSVKLYCFVTIFIVSQHTKWYVCTGQVKWIV